MSRSAQSVIAPAFLSHHLDWVASLNQIGIGVLVFNGKGDLTYISPKCRSVLGELFCQNLIQQGYKSLLKYLYDHATDANFTDYIRDESLADDFEGGSFREYIHTPHSDLVSISVLPLGVNERIAFIHDLHYINTQQKINRDLSEQRNMLLQAVEYGQTGLLVFDADHTDQPVLFVNESCCRFLNVERVDLLGRPWAPIFPEVKHETSYRVIRRQHEERQRVMGCQLTLHQSLGIIFIADITDLHEKEEQVRQINKLDTLGQLAGGIAHDFNNILGIIRGYAHILDRRLQNDETMATPLASILRACERGAGLSQKLLAFGRRKSDDQQITHIQDTVNQLQSMIKPLLPSNTELVVMLPDKPMHAACTSDHLTQIMMNLVINARDAMPSGGLITIDGSFKLGRDLRSWPMTFDLDRTYVKLAVIDQGTGMSADVQEHIFEPFFTTKPVGKGTGLGLAVVYGLVQQHKGAIRVRSEENIGTVFEIVFQTAEHEYPVNNINTDLVSFTGLTVMIVDDETELRDALALYLNDLGMKVIKAADGNDALYQQDSYDGRIDMLISDVRMPELNGADLVRLWRDVRPETKMALMTADIGKTDLGNFPSHNILKKPINFDDLPKFMTHILQSSIGEN